MYFVASSEEINGRKSSGFTYTNTNALLISARNTHTHTRTPHLHLLVVQNLQKQEENGFGGRKCAALHTVQKLFSLEIFLRTHNTHTHIHVTPELFRGNQIFSRFLCVCHFTFKTE